jgi:glycosyltransferase involved in cell wall biosynthesis
MSMAPESKISVIVPCLNEEKMLPLFLSSLKNQFIWSVIGCSQCWSYERRRFPFELVVVDGGSIDRSLSVIDSYRSKMPVTGILDTTRSLGLVRNKGALVAKSAFLFFTNSDAILPMHILPRIYDEFKRNPSLIALSGRTVPINGGTICTAAYAAFDLLRWMFNKIGGFSPSGNFLVIRASVFFDIGGFHNLRVNEDGELGYRIREYARSIGGKTRFRLNLHVWHNADRFRNNSLRALLFYLYVFGNFSSVLKRILQPIEQKSSREF